MLQQLRGAADRLLGRGSAAISVPVMDGTLKPNRRLDEAAVVAPLPGIDDVAGNGRVLVVSAGATLWRLQGDTLVELRRFDADISALALSAQGRLAVGLGGRRVLVLDGLDGSELARLDSAAGQPLVAVNGLAFLGEDRLLLTDGSATRGPAQWCHDLMEHGRSGRLLRWPFAGSQVEVLAHHLHHAFGALALGDAVLVSESWRHRVMRVQTTGPTRALVAELPGYPSRMAPAAAGGVWLSCFFCRTQLVEFVLREDAYRKRMLAEIDPRHWIAPALASGQSFLEPLQGAGVKQMGVLKPWAPPRSYGLVLRVADDGRILESMHSQVDGHHHGITGLAEHAGALYAVSKGSAKLLRVELGDTA